MTPSTELNFGDLELLHQWLTSTCKAHGQLPEMTVHIQSTILPLAQAHPFVMHGILAMAATHLSRLRPSRQKHYSVAAARHHENGLPDFQSALQDINRTNCHAVMSFSKTLLWCSIANGGSYNEQRNSSSRENWLPQWFHLLRGSCLVVETSRPWIQDGPHVLYDLDDTADCSKNPDVQQISKLMSQVPQLTDHPLCMTVLAVLRESFARASMHHHSTPVRNAINFWISSLPDEYIELLQGKELWALIVLAHFCVLFYRFETAWYMKAQATRLMLMITESLDPTWKRWIEWPGQEVGIE